MKSITTMPENARVWVYQSNRILTEAEITTIKKAAELFIVDWSAHGATLKASFDILHNLFIVIAVDEQQAMASGCSIDKSVHFIKELELKLNLNFFDRLRVAYIQQEEIKICHLSTFEELAKNNMVNEETIVFNNMVTTKRAFNHEWEVPLKNSWQSKILS
ncbi:MAG: ABC transporter ATPase [Bacteroidia bacterium]|nr:ABC transporter ATPase [Bacteroidia bacterium]